MPQFVCQLLVSQASTVLDTVSSVGLQVRRRYGDTLLRCVRSGIVIIQTCLHSFERITLTWSSVACTVDCQLLATPPPIMSQIPMKRTKLFCSLWKARVLGAVCLKISFDVLLPSVHSLQPCFSFQVRRSSGRLVWSLCFLLACSKTQMPFDHLSLLPCFGSLT